MNWIDLEKKRNKYEKRYERAFVTAFKRQLMPLINEFRSSNDYSLILSSIDTLIKEDEVNKTFLKLYKDVGLDFKNVEVLLKSLEDDLFLQDMEDYVLSEIIRKRIKSITLTNKERIRKLIVLEIAEGQELGLGIDEIAKRMRKNVPNAWDKYAKTRAKMIAQTEVISASNKASLIGARRVGIPMRKVWLTAPLGIAKKERHNLLDIQPVMLNEKFHVDGDLLDFPGDPAGRSDNIINCRCTEAFEVIEED